MKIAILTLPLNTNYGGILQAYALQTTLEQIGHQAIVLDTNRYPTINPFKAILAYPLRIYKRYIKGDKRIVIRREHKTKQKNLFLCRNTETFIRKHIKRLEYSSLANLSSYNFNAIIVGSDQIWRPTYFKPIENAFLLFARDWNVKRITYAASFGTNDWEYTTEQTNRCKALVKKFDAISVREDSGVRLCQQYLNIQAKHVLDPTMLLTAQDYIKLIPKDFLVTPSKRELFIYILDKTSKKQQIIDYIANEKSLEKHNVGALIYDESLPLTERIQPPVEVWLEGFINADFVVTDSFHACVFSILFKKPFIAIGNQQRGMTRFKSLLTMFNLKDRLIYEKDDPTEILYKDIDWNSIDYLLAEKRKHSLDFLYSTLK